MIKNKFMLAISVAVPFFTMTSCNKGGVEVVLDTGIGMFLNGDCYRTITVTKGASLSYTLGEDIPLAEGYVVISNGDDLTMPPKYWVDDNNNVINWNDGIGGPTTLHARYYSSIDEAKALTLGKIGGSFMDAGARQPEKIAELFVAYQIAADHVARAVSEGGIIGIGKVGSSEMDACARQPEVINDIANVAEYYFNTLEAKEERLSNCMGIGVGKTGSAAMDACGRQPEAIEKADGKDIMTASSIFVSEAKRIPVYSGFGYGQFGNNFMDGCARQPEAIGKLIENTPITFSGLSRAKSSTQSIAIGKVAGNWADACARQPEAIEKLSNALAQNIENILKTVK